MMNSSSSMVAGLYAHLLLCACCGIATTATAAETTAELRAEADKWLSREKIKMSYKSADNRWTSVLETNVREGTTWFFGRDYCLRQPAPTKIEFNGTELVFAFKLPNGCTEIQYRFNPITGHGTIYAAPPGTDTWVPSASSITLLK